MVYDGQWVSPIRPVNERTSCGIVRIRAYAEQHVMAYTSTIGAIADQS